MAGWCVVANASVEAATVAGDIRSLLNSILCLEPEQQVTHRGVAPHVWVDGLSSPAKPEHRSSVNILYWGTPSYAVPTLSALHQAGHQIVGVVTQPDRRRGRGKKPVHRREGTSARAGVPVFTPERIKLIKPASSSWRPSTRTSALLLPSARSCRCPCWNNRHWVAGTAMARCCRAGVVPHRSNGRCSKAMPKPGLG